MKNLLSKPKVVVPVVAIIVFFVTFSLYHRIGIAPIVPASIDLSTSAPAVTSGSNISLSFSKPGRLESLSVKEGDKVTKGETLATLSAPDAEGLVSQAKGALALAQAQYASMNVDYANTKTQQDLLVSNAYKTLLSGDLEGVPSEQDPDVPIISGTYNCSTEGSYILKSYSSSNSDSQYSVAYSGLETGTMTVAYDTPVPMGTCGLQVKFAHVANFDTNTTWTIAVPNTTSDTYLINKNAYDLAVSNRDKALADFVSQVGDNANDPSVAKAQIDAAEGAYEAALGAYQDNLIVAPVDGTVTFIDSDLKPGQSVTSGKSVISITQ